MSTLPVHSIHCSPRFQSSHLNIMSNIHSSSSYNTYKHRSSIVQFSELKKSNQQRRLLNKLKALDIQENKWIYFISSSPKKQSDFILEAGYDLSRIMPIKPSTKYSLISLCGKILVNNNASLILIEQAKEKEKASLLELSASHNNVPLLFLN